MTLLVSAFRSTSTFLRTIVVFGMTVAALATFEMVVAPPAVAIMGCPNIKCVSPESQFCLVSNGWGCCQSEGCADYDCATTLDPCN